MEQMGMTDKQFNGFLRQLIKSSKKRNENEDREKTRRNQRDNRDLQKTLED